MFKKGEIVYLISFIPKNRIFRTFAKVEILKDSVPGYTIKAIKVYYDDYWHLADGKKAVGIYFSEKSLYRKDEIGKQVPSKLKAQMIVSVFEFPNFIGGM